MKDITVGYAICGSFCTFKKSLEVLENVTKQYKNVIPIMSEISYSTDTRFGKAEEIKSIITQLTGNEIIYTVKGAEPIGPKKVLDALIIAPATGNTIAKIANGITDTSVSMAAKAILRNERPVILCVSTNDGLSNSAKNIGQLMNMRNVFIVPLKQDDPIKKPRSIVADFDKIIETTELALEGKQIQPMF